MSASMKQIRDELHHASEEDLRAYLLRLSRFKKENKALLTYLLFQSQDEDGFVQAVKDEVDPLWLEMNTSSFYFMKKSVRKILRIIKLNIRFSAKAETEAELLLYFCTRLSALQPSIRQNAALRNLLDRQAQQLRSTLKKLHPDLRYDLEQELKGVLKG